MLTKDQALRRCARIDTRRWKLRRSVREATDSFLLHLIHEANLDSAPKDRYYLLLCREYFIDFIEILVRRIEDYIGPFFYSDHAVLHVEAPSTKRIRRLEMYCAQVSKYDSGAFFLWVYETLFLHPHFLRPNQPEAPMVASAPFLEYVEHFVHAVTAAIASFLKETT